MPRNHSALREKVLGGNHARRKMLRLRRGLRLRCGLLRRRGFCDGWGSGRREGLLRPKRGAQSQIDEKTCGQRGAGPCGAVWPHKRKTVGLPCLVRTDRTIDDRIEHWLRDAHPRPDSHFPLSEDLPMGISAKAIG
jgi:hypothetical protein